MTGGGGGGGGTVGVSHVYHNRDLLKDRHTRGGTCPWCPPGSAAYAQSLLLSIGSNLELRYLFGDYIQ